MQSVLSSLEICDPEISDASLVTKHLICRAGVPAWPRLLSLEARGAGTGGRAGFAAGGPESRWVGRRRGRRGQTNVNCLRSAEQVLSNPDIAKRLRSGDDSHEAVANNSKRLRSCNCGASRAESARDGLASCRHVTAFRCGDAQQPPLTTRPT
jgi:hypothetical protein